MEYVVFKLVWAYEDLLKVKVLTFCITSNHFHLRRLISAVGKGLPIFRHGPAM